MTIYEIDKTYKLTSPYGARPQFNDYHWGVDYGTPIGVVLHAHIDGKLVLSGTYAKETIVTLEALDGSCNWTFGHLSEAYFKPGVVVKAGTIIGKTGNSGNSTGPHIHVEYDTGRFKGSITANHNAGTTINPLPFIRKEPDMNIILWSYTAPLYAKLKKPIPFYDIATNQEIGLTGYEALFSHRTLDTPHGFGWVVFQDRAEKGQAYGCRVDDVWGNADGEPHHLFPEPTPIPLPDPETAEKARKYDKAKQSLDTFRGLMS